MQNKTKYCTFYIVRHGETDWNVKKLLQGQQDIPLNKNGEVQALNLKEKLSSIHFDAVFSSDLLRTTKTAEIITLERKIEVQTTRALRERNFGRLEGESWENGTPELKKLLNQLTVMSLEEKRKHGLENAETNEEMMNRFIPFMREVAIAYKGKTILMTSHGGTMRAFLIHLGYGTNETLRSGSISNTGYVKIESDGVDFFIKETYGVKKTNI